MKKIVRNIILVVVALVVLVGAASALVVTQENEYTIVRQFGKVVNVHDTAGLSFKLPFIQDTQKLPNTVLLYDLPVSDVITKDKKTMVADSFVLWRISDPQKFIQTPQLQRLQRREPSQHSGLQQHEKHHLRHEPERGDLRTGTASWPAPSRPVSRAWSSTASS